VKVVLRDLKGDPATAVAVTKDMVDTDKVIAVVGGQDESSVSVWPKAFSDAGIPVLAIGYSPATFLQSFNGMKGVYAVSTQFPGVVGEQFIAAKAVGATKFGVVSCAEVVSCSSSEPLYVPFASKVSIGYGGLLKGALADPTYVPQCLSMQSNGVDFLQISASFVLGQRLVDDCAKQGYKPIFGASAGSVYGPDMVPLSQKGAVFAGGLNGFPWYGDSAPIKQFRDVMAKYAPGKTLEDPHITATWAAFELFRKAIANVSDNPTKDEMMNLITSVKNERLNGLLPQPLTFVKGQSGQPIDCFWPYKLANGVFSGPTTPGCWE
jgi:branched-chain amino acid transport system substrate-binding protein